MLAPKIVIAGIGTEVGKTRMAAIVSQALDADYWKPVQAGELVATDTDWVCAHTRWQKARAWPEAVRLQAAMSPHAAAKLENRRIDLDALTPPDHQRPLVIELAGGIMVPLNDQQLWVDWLPTLQAPVILVCRDYLGSINHTLLTLEALAQRQIPVLGLIYTDTPNPETRRFVQQYSKLEVLLQVPHHDHWSPELITTYAQRLRQHPAMAGF